VCARRGRGAAALHWRRGAVLLRVLSVDSVLDGRWRRETPGKEGSRPSTTCSTKRRRHGTDESVQRGWRRVMRACLGSEWCTVQPRSAAKTDRAIGCVHLTNSGCRGHHGSEQPRWGCGARGHVWGCLGGRRSVVRQRCMPGRARPATAWEGCRPSTCTRRWSPQQGARACKGIGTVGEHSCQGGAVNHQGVAGLV
jgi:hypothetical protein